MITTLTRLKVNVEDASSGFRAIRTSVVDNMEIRENCTCGTRAPLKVLRKQRLYETYPSFCRLPSTFWTLSSRVSLSVWRITSGFSGTS